jgi:hypothetical protein
MIPRFVVVPLVAIKTSDRPHTTNLLNAFIKGWREMATSYGMDSNITLMHHLRSDECPHTCTQSWKCVAGGDTDAAAESCKCPRHRKPATAALPDPPPEACCDIGDVD